MLRLPRWTRLARFLRLALMALPWTLWPSAGQALDKDTEDTIRLLTDLMVRGCGLGQSVIISGEASAIGVLGFRMPGVTGAIEGTYEEIPSILKGLVPESQQATEIRDCMIVFMQQIFDVVLADVLQSESTKKEIKLIQLNKVFAGGNASRIKVAVDSALRSSDPNLKQSALSGALRSGNRELQHRALVHLLSQVKTIGGIAIFREDKSPFQIVLKDFNLETGEFTGIFVAPFLKEEQKYGAGRLSGTALTLVNNLCALHAELKEAQNMEGIMTCTKIVFGNWGYSRVTLEASLVVF